MSRPNRKSTARIRLRPPRKRVLRRLGRATRGRRGSALLAALSFAVGLLSGYLSDLALLAVPPGLVLDAASSDTVRVTVLRERDQGTQGELWLLPFALSTARPELVERLDRQVRSRQWDTFHDELYKAGGIDANVSIMKLVVEGRRNTPVVITGMRALSKKAEPSTDFTLIGPGPQGNAATAKVVFDLDEEDPIARVPTSADLESVEHFGLPYFSDNTVSLARGEKQVFQVVASTKRYDVEWSIELTMQVDGDQQRLVVDDGGKPLRTSVAVYSPGSGRWEPDESKYREVYDVLGSTFERRK